MLCILTFFILPFKCDSSGLNLLSTANFNTATWWLTDAVPSYNYCGEMVPMSFSGKRAYVIMVLSAVPGLASDCFCCPQEHMYD
jgi:hypothetical protein